MSKSDQGKVFQDAVAQSLRIAGWRVEGEQLLGHKKVDLVAKQVQLGQDFIVAVECKHYNRPLHMQEVVKIWADYAPLVAKRLVDQVLIVTAEGFAPNALNYVESIPGLRTQTMSGILNTAIDFSSYLQTLIADFDDAADGLPHYYIGPRTTNEVDLRKLSGCGLKDLKSLILRITAMPAQTSHSLSWVRTGSAKARLRRICRPQWQRKQ